MTNKRCCDCVHFHRDDRDEQPYCFYGVLVKLNPKNVCYKYKRKWYKFGRAR